MQFRIMPCFICNANQALTIASGIRAVKGAAFPIVLLAGPWRPCLALPLLCMWHPCLALPLLCIYNTK